VNVTHQQDDAHNLTNENALPCTGFATFTDELRLLKGKKNRYVKNVAVFLLLSVIN